MTPADLDLHCFSRRVKNLKKVMYRGRLHDRIQLLAWLPCKIYYFVLFYYITGEGFKPKYFLIRGTWLYTCIGIYIGLYIGNNISEEH